MDNKGKREKGLELRDILQELKKQTFINFIFSVNLAVFTIAIFVYEVYKIYWKAAVLGLIGGAVLVLYIKYKFKKYNIN